jgi:transposase
MDIRVILTHIQAGSSNRQVERDLNVDRRTVKRYREWAKEQGILEGDLPDIEHLQKLVEETLPTKQPPQNISTVEPYREIVEKLVKQKVEAKAIYHRLEERGFEGSYSAVYRFVRRIKDQHPEATVRVERPPGEEAQVDFGYAGMMIDPESGKRRRTWAFVMTLSWSRHQYIEFVFDQKIETWLRCHRNAFSFFEGVPQRVVIDNLKAAIVKAIRDDPQVQRSYQECALHYSFLIAPCQVGKPEHKGKVEQGGVHYVKRNFLGGREPTTVTQANRDVLVWCNTTAGLRTHGTTKEQPLKRFEEIEKERLQPLPDTPYDMAVWKQLKLGRDCYIEFDKSYYSAPHRLVGQMLRVCGGLQQVRIFDQDYHLLATHERADKPGTRRTHHDHLPPEKLPGLLLNRESCQVTAAEIGPATSLVVQTLLDDPVVDRLPTVGRLLRLRLKYSDERLEAACVRALSFGDPTYKTVKGILQKGTEKQPVPKIIPSPPATAFVRLPEELFGTSLLEECSSGAGGEKWN